MEYERCFEKLKAAVEEKLSGAPGCHDWGHTERVLHNARILADMENGCDGMVSECGALLHDIARALELDSKGGKCHAEHGAELVFGLLRDAGFSDPEFAKKVRLCVLRHRFRGGNPPVAIEEKVVYDADKLDSVGAVGIGRAFHFAGRVGAKLHNTEEEALAGSSYSLQDTAYREYLVKLRHIRERMLTGSGKKVAERRTRFMDEFFMELNREIYS